MARVFIEGFELRHLQNWNGGLIYSTYIVNDATSYGLSGGYYFNSGDGRTIYKDLTAADEYYCAFKVHMTAAAGATFITVESPTSQVLCTLYGSFGGANNHVSLIAGASTHVGTINLTTGQPYRIELRYKASTSNTGNAQVKVNGVLDIDKTSTITASTSTNIQRIVFIGQNNIRLDDIVVDNAQWPGNTRIQQLMPDGSGTSTGWTPSAVDNYDCVNDLSTTLTSVDADYVYASTTPKLDAYAMAALVEGSNPISEIKCIQVTARAKIDGSNTACNAMKLKVITTSATYESAVTQVQEDAWAHYTYLKSDTANITTAHMANISIGLETTKV